MSRVRRAPDKLRRLRLAAAQSGQLSQELGRLREHVTHLEERLHIAEHATTKLAEHGLLAPLLHEPENFARWLTWSPPGHFYSPIPNLAELERQADTLWPAESPTALPGIAFDTEAHLAFFDGLAELARPVEVPEHQTEPWRYHSENVSFGIGDALMLHAMLRQIQPARLIEIGSGFSSAMTLDTVEHFLDGKTELTFIEPYPELLESLLRPADRDRVTIIAKPLQTVPLELFATLTDSDVLFIDSTHVLRTGSDVVWLYNELLPTINAGVYVHIHDIFRSFEYPKEWVMEGRAWGEAYLVRAFLTLNDDFEILLFNNWLGHFHQDRIAEILPQMLANTGGSLWLRRVRKSR
ncbi:MAG: class I SAM-dependent methyltransferase [Actinomycetota bacterium]|nr:class I SAM-dependent methyltransferase [Actinomycetota bacterium]